MFSNNKKNLEMYFFIIIHKLSRLTLPFVTTTDATEELCHVFIT